MTPRFLRLFVLFIGSVLIVGMLLRSAVAETSGGAHQISGVAVAPELWLVSTRKAPCCCPTEQRTSYLTYWHCEAGQQWRRSSLQELFLTDDPDVTTLIYVHENRVTRSESFRRSHILLSSLQKTVSPHQPFRLIVFSWPANRIGWRPRPDVQEKARRSQAHGFYLAWLIDQMHPEVPISLFGTSFGPRMITAALHVLGGGRVKGQPPLARVHSERRPVRIALMAAALDTHWLIPGQRHGNALTQIENMLVLVNRNDKILRWYPQMDGRGGPEALGFAGLTDGRYLDTYRDRIVEWDVSCDIGKVHSWCAYEGSPTMLAMIIPYLFADGSSAN